MLQIHSNSRLKVGKFARPILWEFQALNSLNRSRLARGRGALPLRVMAPYGHRGRGFPKLGNPLRGAL